MKTFKKRSGMGMVEVITGVTIITIAILSLIAVFNFYLQVMLRNTPSIQSSYLLEESLEVVRLLRDQSWNQNIASLSVASSSKYYLFFNATTSKWMTTTTAQALIDGKFERTISAGSTYRDSDNNIVPESYLGSKTLDASTTLIIAKVSWQGVNGTTTKTLSAYFTNLFGN